MKNFPRLMVFLCGLGGLALNVRGLVRSINNNENVVADIVGVCIWIVYIVALQYNFKLKNRKKDT